MRVTDWSPEVKTSAAWRSFGVFSVTEQAACHARTHRDVEQREGATPALVHQVAVKAQAPEEVRLRDVLLLHDLHAVVWERSYSQVFCVARRES